MGVAFMRTSEIHGGFDCVAGRLKLEKMSDLQLGVPAEKIYRSCHPPSHGKCWLYLG